MMNESSAPQVPAGNALSNLHLPSHNQLINKLQRPAHALSNIAIKFMPYSFHLMLI